MAITSTNDTAARADIEEMLAPCFDEAATEVGVVLATQGGRCQLVALNLSLFEAMEMLINAARQLAMQSGMVSDAENATEKGPIQ